MGVFFGGGVWLGFFLLLLLFFAYSLLACLFLLCFLCLVCGGGGVGVGEGRDRVHGQVIFYFFVVDNCAAFIVSTVV